MKDFIYLVLCGVILAGCGKKPDITILPDDYYKSCVVLEHELVVEQNAIHQLQFKKLTGYRKRDIARQSLRLLNPKQTVGVLASLVIVPAALDQFTEEDERMFAFHSSRYLGLAQVVIKKKCPSTPSVKMAVKKFKKETKSGKSGGNLGQLGNIGNLF